MAGIEEHRSARDPAKVVSDYYFRLEHLLLVVDTYFILLLCVLFCFVFLFDFLFQRFLVSAFSRKMGSSKWDTHTVIINIIWSKGIVNQCDFIDFFIDFEGTMIVENKPRYVHENELFSRIL